MVSRGTLLLIVSSGLSLSACLKLQPLPAVPPPTILSAQAICDKVSGVYQLDSVRVQVENAEGIAHLQEPFLQVSSVRLQPLEEIPGETSPEDPVDTPIRITYAWQRTLESEQILCGDGGDELTAVFEVFNRQGFHSQPLVIQAEPAE